MDKLKFQYARKRAGLTAAELCEKIGISQSAYARKCRGDTEFTRVEIQRIIEVLKLDDLWLFSTDKAS